MTPVVIVGASTRAAATSALRAGWTPWCADLFADADLERIATVRKIPADQYPEGILDALKDAPPGPLMYTGALENRPDLIAKFDRPLLGNSAEVVRAVRDPLRWAECLRGHGMPCPAFGMAHTTNGRWLLKLRKSAAGFGIHPYSGQAFNSRTHFLQEYLDGTPASAVFFATDGHATLLGASEQLIGTPWLNATGFHYAGSIGPLDASLESWQAVGNALARAFPLVGLFGVDAILREGIPWTIEINPRYTASVEVIERGKRQSVMRLYQPGVQATGMTNNAPSLALRAGAEKIGKAILFARMKFAFPERGPWFAALEPGVNLDETEYADLPHAGEIIEQGHPVLTLFASGPTVEECRGKLKEKAQALDRRLWG